MMFRSAAMVYCSDAYENIKSINITEYLSYYDLAFGNDQKIDVVKVKIGKEIFKQLNLRHLNIEELFVRVLKTLQSRKPEPLRFQFEHVWI
jgi:hypothetical protein